MNITDPLTDLSPLDPKKSPLYQRVVQGGVWVFALRAAQQLLAMGRLIVLMWLLAPKDFGMLGIALLTMAILNTFTQTGFQLALIQKKQDTHSFLNAAWTVGLIRCMLLFILLFLIAPLAVVLLDHKPMLKDQHIDKPLELISQLQQNTDTLSIHLLENLAPETVSLFKIQPEDEAGVNLLKNALASDLNHIINKDRLFQDDMIATLILSEHNNKRLNQYKQHNETVRVNLFLLEQAYPGAIKEVLTDRITGIQIIRVIGLTFLLGAFSNIGIIYFSKELEFHKQFIYEICGVLTSVSVTIVLAYLYRNVWALVIGKLAAQLVQTILGYILHPYRPRLSWDTKKIVELWKYGRWILGSTILGFLITQGDDLFIAKLFGVTALGFYQVAYRIAVMPAQEITKVFSQVTFPAYAIIQDDRPRLRDAYLKVLQLITFLSLPLGGAIIILAPDFIRLFIKKDWEPIIPIVQILILWGTMSSIGSTAGALFNAIGKTKLSAKMQFIKLFILASLIYPLSLRWNLAGTAWAVVISTLCVQPMALYLVYKMIQCRLWDLGRRIVFPLAATISMVGFIALGKYVMLDEVTVFSFFFLAVIGLISYIGSMAFFDRFCGYGGRALITEQVSYLLGKKPKSIKNT